MRIGIGSNQSGVEFTEVLKLKFGNQGHAFEDLNTHSSVLGSYHNVTDQLASASRGRRVDRGERAGCPEARTPLK